MGNSSFCDSPPLVPCSAWPEVCYTSLCVAVVHTGAVSKVALRSACCELLWASVVRSCKCVNSPYLMFWERGSAPVMPTSTTGGRHCAPEPMHSHCTNQSPEESQTAEHFFCHKCRKMFWNRKCKSFRGGKMYLNLMFGYRLRVSWWCPSPRKLQVKSEESHSHWTWLVFGGRKTPLNEIKAYFSIWFGWNVAQCGLNLHEWWNACIKVIDSLQSTKTFFML